MFAIAADSDSLRVQMKVKQLGGKDAGKWWIKESERETGSARRRELRAAKGQCAEEWHANAEESNEGEEETNEKRKERQKRLAVDTDEEKEQVYGTEIAGHSVNLALCSYSRQRIKGSGGKEAAFASVVFLADPPRLGAFQLRNPAKSSDDSSRVFVYRLYPSLWCPLWSYFSFSSSPFLPSPSAPFSPPFVSIFLSFPHPLVSLKRLNKRALLFVRHGVNSSSCKNRRRELPRLPEVSVLGYLCPSLHSRVAISWQFDCDFQTTPILQRERRVAFRDRSIRFDAKS